jgi:hypothetical protein
VCAFEAHDLFIAVDLFSYPVALFASNIRHRGVLSGQ